MERALVEVYFASFITLLNIVPDLLSIIVVYDF